MNHDIYVTSGVQKEAQATFDDLSALDVLQGMELINKHYSQARRWQVQSGNYKPFHVYCANRPYLLLSHNNLLKCGDQVIFDGQENRISRKRSAKTAEKKQM